MAFSVEYALEEIMDLSQGNVMLMTRQEARKLSISDSNPGIGKGGLSTPNRADGLYAPLCRL